MSKKNKSQSKKPTTTLNSFAALVGKEPEMAPTTTNITNIVVVEKRSPRDLLIEKLEVLYHHQVGTLESTIWMRARKKRDCPALRKILQAIDHLRLLGVAESDSWITSLKEEVPEYAGQLQLYIEARQLRRQLLEEITANTQDPELLKLRQEVVQEIYHVTLTSINPTYCRRFQNAEGKLCMAEDRVIQYLTGDPWARGWRAPAPQESPYKVTPLSEHPLAGGFKSTRGFWGW